MRKITLLVIACFSTMLLFSCKDELELKPFDQLEESSALVKPKDFTAAIRGAYSRMFGGENGDYYPRKMILADVLSDNLIICQDGRLSLQKMYDFTYNANSVEDGILFYAYSTADRANRIIENIDKLEDGAFKDDILGQAKAIRALAHFDVAINYAPSFTAVNSNDPNTGVPIKDHTDALAKPARATLQETFDFIVSELKDAASLIDDSRANVASGFMNKAAVNTLLSRVYLYMGDYANAKIAAQDAVNEAGSEDVAIGSRAEFPHIWTDNSAGDAGILFKLVVTEQDRVRPGVEYNQGYPNNIRSEYVPTFELYSLYDSSDVRKDAYILTSAYSTGNIYNNVIKYAQRPGGTIGVVDVKVVRGAEAYLNLAEAAARTGDDGTAITALDAVRSRRYASFVSPNETGQALLDAIMLQRRLEFAFEGQRFYDLKRLGLPIVRSATEGDRYDGTGVPAPATARNISANDHRFALPIPTAERQANTNFEQSPGY